MAARQTRRSVSLNRQLYERLRRISLERSLSMAKLAEQAIRASYGIAETARPAGRTGTCACCGEIGTVVPTRLDPGGPEYLICEGCNTTAAPDVPRGRARPREARA